MLARVDRAARHATQANHTATHLLQAALRERFGGHVRQAGSYVGPDKLRFDFSHGQGLTESELRDVEDQVNAWIARNDPVRPITTTLAEARRLGRDGAVRREVRRGGAHGGGRRGGVLARAVRRHARALDGRDRPVSHPQRDVERRERKTDRGGDGTGGGGAAARARPPARRDRHVASQARPEDVPEAVRHSRGRTQGAGKGIEEGRGRADPSTSELRPVARVVDAPARRCSLRRSMFPTPRLCSTWSIVSRAGSTMRSSCWAAAVDGRVLCSRASRPPSSREACRRERS